MFIRRTSTIIRTTVSIYSTKWSASRRLVDAVSKTDKRAIKDFVDRWQNAEGNEVEGAPFDVRLSPEPFASEAEACDFAEAAARDVIDGLCE